MIVLSTQKYTNNCTILIIIFFILYCCLLCDSSHSDNNLVELENATVKEEDRAVLLEGGLSKSASTKVSSSSIKTNIVRSVHCADWWIFLELP